MNIVISIGGIILVEQNSGKKSVEFTLDGVTQQIKCVDVTARIIDFTFSRMTKGIELGFLLLFFCVEILVKCQNSG